MKIKHFDGEKFYYAFFWGKKEVLKKRGHLDKINVFPVADGDTGTNLALTMQSIMDGTKMGPSVSEVSKGMAEAALIGSKGNSGIIFAQFLHGISKAIEDRKHLTLKEFAHAMREGVEHAYQALSKPVEGTILTVMKAWSNALHVLHEKSDDYSDLLSKALIAAKKALRETPNKLKVLKNAGVVDAGAQGFVHFLEGIGHFLKHGLKPEMTEDAGIAFDSVNDHVEAFEQEWTTRYCMETVIKGENLNVETIRTAVAGMCDSLIVAGSENRIKVHLHTDEPAGLFSRLRKFGLIIHQKVDDMKRQYETIHHRKSSIALVVDSACDLPQNLLDEYQIHMVPVQINFGNQQYLDKLTLTADQFYTMLDEGALTPKSSQPPVHSFEMLYRSLLTHYNSIISLHLSKELSGTWNAAKLAAENVNPQKISVINSKNLSTTMGLIALKTAQKLKGGASHEEVVRYAERLPEKSKLLVSVKNLKYLVRGGRVSRVKGLLARLLNLKPIISLDETGASRFYGKAFSYKANINKILKIVERHHLKHPIQHFAIGHAHADEEADKFHERLTQIIGKNAEYVMDISPTIGAHAGIGAMSVSIMMA